MSDAWAKWRSCVRAVDLYPADNPNRPAYLEREHAAAQIAVRTPAASGGADQEDADPFAALRALPEWQALVEAEAHLTDACRSQHSVMNTYARLDELPDAEARVKTEVGRVRLRLALLIRAIPGAPSTDPAPEPGDATWPECEGAGCGYRHDPNLRCFTASTVGRLLDQGDIWNARCQACGQQSVGYTSQAVAQAAAARHDAGCEAVRRANDAPPAPEDGEA